MKKQIPYFIAIAFLLLACSISVNLTPEPATPSQPTAVIFTVTAVPTEVPAQPVVQANVICNQLSLYLDPALGSGYDCQTIAEASGADMPYFAINPQYTEINITGYVLADKFFSPHIDLFPVQRFSELAPDAVPERVQELQNLIAGGVPGDGGLPFLPFFNAGQVFYSQAAIVQFQNGKGIRYLTEYAQYAAPINNHDLFYTYQGLTSDGQYWVSVVLPITNSILPTDASNPPGGQSWEDFTNGYEAYLSDITTQLNSQSPGSFAPTINMLDALINSIVVQP